jgi:flagellin
MGLRINTNTDALDAYRNLSITQNNMSSSLQKLSSGYQINKAADNASGLSISEGLQVQTADGALTEVDSILQRMNDLAVQASNTGSQDTAARQAAQTEVTQLNADLDNIGNTTQYGQSNLLDGTFGTTAASTSGAISGATTGVTLTSSNNAFGITGTFNTASGGTVALAAGSTGAVTIKAGSYTTASSYQTAVQNALDTTATANGLAAGTLTANVADEGNGVWKLTLSSSQVGSGNTFAVAAAGTAPGLTAASTSSAEGAAGGVFQIGSNDISADQLKVTIAAVNSTSLGTAGIDLVNNAAAAITTIQNAITTVSSERSQLGAYQNGFQHTINNLNVTVENLQSSNSSIMDTDMASEMVNFTQQQVLEQAGVSMLSQANSESQSVLKLLQG